MLIWIIGGITSVIILGLIGGGLWLMQAERAKNAQSTVPGQGVPASRSGPGQRPKPRAPISKMSGGCLLPFGLFWTVFSSLFLVLPIGMFYSQWQTYTLLRDSGATVEGVIISQRIDDDSDGDTYYVTYRYTAPLPQGDRQQFSREESVSSDLYETLKPEQRAIIRYAITDPATARLEQAFGPPSPFIFLMSGMGGVFTLIGLVLIGVSLKAIYTASQLIRYGKFAPASIVERWTETDSDGDKTYVVSYYFNTSEGVPVTAAEYNRLAYNKYQPGDAVRVRYLPNNPQTCRLEL